MANDVKIVINVVDNASKAISGIQGKLAQFGITGQSIAGKLQSVATGVMAVAGAAGVASTALIGAGMAVKRIADDYFRYAMQVESLGKKIGATAEETSRLIQVADDAQVSYEALSAAMLGAVRKGVDPSINSLMRLSDAYLKLEPGLQRTRFLLENFGRSGAEMARLMELGGDKIAEMSGEIGESLIVTEENVQAAKDYYEAVDTVGDAWQGVKNTIGVDVMNATTLVINKTLWLIDAVRQIGILNNLYADGKISKELYFQMLQMDTVQVQAYLNRTIETESALLHQAVVLEGDRLAATKQVTEEISKRASMRDQPDREIKFTPYVDLDKIAQDAQKAAEMVAAAFWDVNPSLTSAIEDAIDKVTWMEAGGAGVEKLFDAVMLNAPKLGDQLGNALQQVLIQSLATSVKAGMESAYAAAIKLRDESRKLGININYDQARAIINEAVSQPVDKPINFTDAQGNPIDLNNLLGEAGEIAPANVPVNLVNAEGEPIDPTTMFVFEEPVNLPVSPVDIMGMPFGTLALQRTIAQPLEIPVMLTNGEGEEFNLANVLEIPDTDDQEKAFSSLATVLLEELSPAADEAQKQISMLAGNMSAAAASARALASSAKSAAMAIATLKSRTIVLTKIIRTVYETIGSPPSSGGGGAIGGPATGMTPEERGELAMGGPVEAGNMYLVGERGPELIVPRESGTVIPNHKLGIGGGGYVVGQINIYAQPGQSPAAVANAVIAEMNRRMASARRSGLAYVG